jgi:5-enolpyruvylshikimate-3-phosphate synthase
VSTSIVDLDTLAAGRAGDAPAVRIPVLGGRRFDATVRVPGSKSLTNRALLLASLAGGSSTITGALLGADDTERMIIALEQLGARIHRTGTASVRVDGVAGVWNPAQPNTRLDLGNAGTAVRFLTAAAILAPVSSEGITIDGDAPLASRSGTRDATACRRCSSPPRGTARTSPIASSSAVSPRRSSCRRCC